MTHDEQKQFEQLQEQLDLEKENVVQIRANSLSALGRMAEEVRLYRGLFWCLLTFTLISVILRLIQR